MKIESNNSLKQNKWYPRKSLSTKARVYFCPNQQRKKLIFNTLIFPSVIFGHLKFIYENH